MSSVRLDTRGSLTLAPGGRSQLIGLKTGGGRTFGPPGVGVGKPMAWQSVAAQHPELSSFQGFLKGLKKTSDSGCHLIAMALL